MHVISLKDFKAREIFKCFEYKLKNNGKISDEDIVSMQGIVYMNYESEFELLLRARTLLEKLLKSLKWI